MNYDLILFCEIIESIQGVQYLRSDDRNGIKVKFYQGLTGRLVMIDVTDEFASDTVYKGYLENLGLSDLIESMFPQKLESEASESSSVNEKLKELGFDKD